MAAAPTRVKKRFGKYMVELRESRELDQAQVAARLRVARASVTRYDSGNVLPPWPAFMLYLDVIDQARTLTEDERAEAVKRWELANDEPRPVRLPSGAPKGYRMLVNAEQTARLVQYISVTAIPGLLQTENYTRAIIQAGQSFLSSETSIDDLVKTRMTRQRVLRGEDPLKLHVLLDVAVINRIVGGPAVMREQLEHLLASAKRPNITLQVIPNEAGAYGPMGGPCIIARYAEPEEQPGVYLEYLAGGAWVEDEGDVSRFTTMFDDVARQALSPAKTSELIREQLRALEDL